MKIKYMLILLFLLILNGCGNVSKTQDVSLMLDYTPNTNHTGIYVALDKGYYEDEGINLSILDNSLSSTVQAVASQKVDFGISYEEDVLLAQDGGINNLESIYGILKENTSGFVSFKDKNIKSPEDFKGKTYCGWGSDVERLLVYEVASLGGVLEEDVNIKNASTDFLRSNQDDCDIFWEYEGWALQEANIEGVDYNYIPLLDLGIDFYSPIIITSDELIENNSDLVQSFINATIKGYEYAFENPEEAANIFLSYNSTYDEDFIQASQKFVSNYYLADNGYAGYEYDNKWKDFSSFLNEKNIIKTKEFEELFTNEFIDKYYES